MPKIPAKDAGSQEHAHIGERRRNSSLRHALRTVRLRRRVPAGGRKPLQDLDPEYFQLRVGPAAFLHFADLALEEIGKAGVVQMKAVSERHGRELPGSISKAMDDHVRKLFWAIWGPSMGSELITADQITSNIGLAQKLHDRRVQALYVDSTDAGVSLPTGIIAADEARSLIRMVEARLEMEKADDHPSEAPAV